MRKRMIKTESNHLNLKVRHTLIFVTIAMVFLYMTYMPAIVNASEIEENIGVTTICPDENEELIIGGGSATIMGKEVPDSAWNISDKGQYDFSGSANTVVLYSNYKFYGKKTYTVYVRNTGSNAITVKARTRLKTYGSTRISAGKTGGFTFSDIKSSTKFYLQFSGSSFNGYIK